MPLVFAAIAPHGGIAIAEACGADERDVALKTRAGMEELGRRFAEAKPEVAIVATPHNVHIANALGVVVASRVKGRLNGVTPPIELDLPSDTGLALRLLDLVQAILRDPFVGLGKPEPLKRLGADIWSRRLTGERTPGKCPTRGRSDSRWLNFSAAPRSVSRLSFARTASTA